MIKIVWSDNSDGVCFILNQSKQQPVLNIDHVHIESLWNTSAPYATYILFLVRLFDEIQFDGPNSRKKMDLMEES